MSKFCPNCGTQLDDSAAFCAMCGTAFVTYEQPYYETPVDPAPAAPAGIAPDLFKKIVAGVLAGMLIFTVIIAIMCFTANYDVTMTVKANGESQSATGPLSEVLEDEDYVPLGIVCIAYAIANLVLAGISALGVKNALTGNFASLKKIGVLGTIINVVYMILFKVCSIQTGSFFGVKMTASLAIPGFVWVVTILFAGIAAFAIVGKKKNMY